MAENKWYIAIDLKSFYASVECVARGLDPLKTNLVVADMSRTEKTICLAVTPSLKKYGIPGRARLFEVIQKVREVNAQRKQKAPYRRFTGRSFDADELDANPSLELNYLVAPPQMALYKKVSTEIVSIYLRHVSMDDVCVYSVDEVFIDVTPYLKVKGMTAREFTKMLIKEVLREKGITATAGIGPNLYLAKVAMDIMAKRVDADEDGVRIAELDEISYRELLWDHQPITDFWRVGHGYAKSLEKVGIYTMGDVAKCSVGDVHGYYNEALLYKLFGINAELLIDHAWGWEPCTMQDIKAYRPATTSLSSGQVLHCPYTYDKARLIVREMTDALVLDLVAKGLVTNQIGLSIGYDIENLTDPNRSQTYKGEVKTDHYGRNMPKPAHGTANLEKYSSSTKLILKTMMELFERIADKRLLIRRINVVANRLIREEDVKREPVVYEQMSMFDLPTEDDDRRAEEEAEAIAREKKMQKVILDIKRRYGKNAILKGMNFEDGATARDRNNQIGGHKA